MSGAARNRLGYLDLSLWIGLNSKATASITQENALRVAKNTDFFTKLGGLSKPPGTKRILTSQYTEASVVKKISWVGFYKAADLNGQILRHPLVAAGTKLHRIETNGTLTSLTGVGFPITETRTEGLFHAADKFGDLYFIQNQDPDLIGNGNTPVKYDGTEIHRWGVIPPGEAETVQETFSNLGSFTITNGTGAAIDTVTTLDGTALKVSASGTTLQINRSGLTPFSVDTTIPDRAQISVYIPRGQIFHLSDVVASPPVSIRVGTNLVTDYYQFDFKRGTLLEGWNTLPLDFTTPSSTVGSPNAAALTTLSIIIRSASALLLATNFRFDRFLSFDKGTLTPAEGPAGTVFTSGGVWSYKVTFGTKYGHDSNAGPQSVSLTTSVARASFSLTGIPTSADPQVINRTIWRTVANGAIHLFHSVIDDNTTTTLTDIIPDVGLGDISTPLEGDVSDDNAIPPQAGIIKTWKDTIFLAGLPDRPETVVFSDVNEPESFPTLNEAILDAKVTAMYEAYSGLVLETELGKWQVTGDNPDFRFDKIINNLGCIGRRAAGETRIQGWTIDREGMRLYDLNNPVKISEVIRDKFDGFDKTNLELTHSAHSKSRNCITMFVANSSKEYKLNNFIYQYPVDSVEQGWWWQLDLPTSYNILHIQEIEDTNGDFHLYAADAAGMVFELFADGEKNWTLADGSAEAIVTTATTKYIRAASTEGNSEDFTGRIQPRMLELRWDGDDDTTWNITIETANGSDQDTATDSIVIPIKFGTDETLLRPPCLAMQPGEYVRLTISNNELNKTGTITGLRLFFTPKPGQYPIETGSMSPILEPSVL